MAGKDDHLFVPDNWYEAKELADGITLIRESHVAPWMRCNIWHIRGRDFDLLIDSGMGLRPLKAEIAILRQRSLKSISTHCHFDHIGGAHEFAIRLGHRSEADVYNRPNLDNTCAKTWLTAELLTASPFIGFELSNYKITPASLTGYLDEGDIIDTGDRNFNIFHMPGHSPGSIALYEAKSRTLFSGDIVYDGELIDNAWHSNPEQYRESLRRLLDLPVEIVHAGHEGSFGHDRLLQLVESYLSGGQRLGDVRAWLADKAGKTAAEPNSRERSN